MLKTKQEVMKYCLTLPDTYEDSPFSDPVWIVARCRKNDKIFAWIFERQGHIWVNVKVDPQWRDFWRDAYESVLPGYHLNKQHWNSVILDGTVPDKEVKRMIADSYDLVRVKRKGRKA